MQKASLRCKSLVLKIDSLPVRAWSRKSARYTLARVSYASTKTFLDPTDDNAEVHVRAAQPIGVAVGAAFFGRVAEHPLQMTAAKRPAPTTRRISRS
jgi:hypothetical protein